MGNCLGGRSMAAGRVEIDIWRAANTFESEVQLARIACQTVATSSDQRDGENLVNRELPRGRSPRVKQFGRMKFGPVSAPIGRAAAGRHVTPGDIKRPSHPRAN